MPKDKGYSKESDNFSKYDPTNAPVIKNGGNSAIQDHVVTSGPTTKPSKQGSAAKVG